MSVFNRMRTSWFPPAEDGGREPRVAKRTKAVPPTPPMTAVDERTADAAKQILENAAFMRVFDRLHAEANAEFAASAPGAAGLVQREMAHVKIRALDEIDTAIRAMADSQKVHNRVKTDAE